MLAKLENNLGILVGALSEDVLKTVRQLPGKGRWLGSQFQFEPTYQSLYYLKQNIPNIIFEDSLEQKFAIEEAAFKTEISNKQVASDTYVFKTTPFQHQLDVFKASRDKEYFALLMEMGTGKTKVSIDTAAWLYKQGKIRTLIIIAPNGVHRNWVHELSTHMPDDVPYCAVYKRAESKQYETELATLKKFDGLKIFTLNYEYVITKKGKEILQQLLVGDCLLILDESTRIKSPNAKTTLETIKLASKAKYRRILTGTPVTQGPIDLFTQFWFLDPSILGFSKFFAFRSFVANLREIRNAKTNRTIKIIDSYKEEGIKYVKQRIAGHSYRILKTECLDLPDKIYRKVFIDPTSEQMKIYNDLKKELISEVNGDDAISAPIIITRLLRFRQLLGGFVPTEEGALYTLNPNPRLDALHELMEEVESSGQQAIIWACFKPELRAIEQLAQEHFDGSFVSYHGEVGQEQRQQAIDLFQVGKKRFFIGQPRAAGIGLTLTAASNVIYYSNDYSLEVRQQSEDRAHRIGQKNNVNYVDIIAHGTVDQKIIEALRNKRNIADIITGDNIRNLL